MIRLFVAQGGERHGRQESEEQRQGQKAKESEEGRSGIEIGAAGRSSSGEAGSGMVASFEVETLQALSWCEVSTITMLLLHQVLPA